MEDVKPVSLNGLVFSDEKGNEITRQSYFMEFHDEIDAESFIQDEYKRFSDIYRKRYGKIVFKLDMNETLTEIEIKSVLRLVCKFRKLRLRDVRSKSQKREFVEARRFAVMICIKRGKDRTAIHEFLGQDHSTITHHVKQFNSYYETDPTYQQSYDECFEFVMTQLNPARMEDGSGEKKKINNSNNGDTRQEDSGRTSPEIAQEP